MTQPINKFKIPPDESENLSFLTINNVLKNKNLESNLLKVDIPYTLAIDIYDPSQNNGHVVPLKLT